MKESLLVNKIWLGIKITFSDQWNIMCWAIDETNSSARLTFKVWRWINPFKINVQIKAFSAELSFSELPLRKQKYIINCLFCCWYSFFSLFYKIWKEDDLLWLDFLLLLKFLVRSFHRHSASTTIISKSISKLTEFRTVASQLENLKWFFYEVHVVLMQWNKKRGFQWGQCCGQEEWIIIQEREVDGGRSNQ